MLTKNSEVIYLHNLIGQLETLEVMYDGMVDEEIIALLKQAKSQSQMELRKAERMNKK